MDVKPAACSATTTGVTQVVRAEVVVVVSGKGGVEHDGNNALTLKSLSKWNKSEIFELISTSNKRTKITS